jgi:hypothetical protein
MTEIQIQQPSNRSNWSAWGSLGCATLACVPPGAIFAIVFGARGIKFARHNQNRGIIPAVLGMICGIGGGLYFVWFCGSMLMCADGTRHFLREFVGNLESGNIAAAQSQCDSTFLAEDLADLSEQLERGGPPTEITFTLPMREGFPDNHGRNIRRCFNVGGTLTIAGATHDFDAGLVRENRTYRVHRFKLH